MIAARSALVIVCLVGAEAAAAQQGPPPRPQLDARADTNDWEAYYDRGVEWLNLRQHVRAEAAFYWASRLEPRRAEPLFARWVAAWARDSRRFIAYLNHDPEKPYPAEMVRIDSLRYRAFQRNPLVFQGLIMAALQQLPGEWGGDAWTDAWLAYSTLNFPRALRASARALKYNHKRFREVRYLRATTYVAMGRLDSAAAELATLRDTLHRQEEERVSEVYESEAMLEYAIGLLQFARQDPQGARAAFEAALVDDLSFYPAHMALGDLATDRRDAAVALAEFERAAALAPDDAVARFAYGVALARSRRPAEAVTELQATLNLEPYFAETYYWLGDARLAQNDSAGARESFQAYTTRASANASQLSSARLRLAALTR